MVNLSEFCCIIKSRASENITYNYNLSMPVKLNTVRKLIQNVNIHLFKSILFFIRSIPILLSYELMIMDKLFCTDEEGFLSIWILYILKLSKLRTLQNFVKWDDTVLCFLYWVRYIRWRSKYFGLGCDTKTRFIRRTVPSLSLLQK